MTDRVKPLTEPFVAGPVWLNAMADVDGEPLWTSEVQTHGGHGVIATVHGASEKEAADRRDAILSALLAMARQSPSPTTQAESAGAGQEVPPTAGVCAYDLDECTVTLALDSAAEVRAVVAALPAKNRVFLVSEQPHD